MLLLYLLQAVCRIPEQYGIQQFLLRIDKTCEIISFPPYISFFNTQKLILFTRFYSLLLVVQLYLYSCLLLIITFCIIYTILHCWQSMNNEIHLQQGIDCFPMKMSRRMSRNCKRVRGLYIKKAHAFCSAKEK